MIRINRKKKDFSKGVVNRIFALVILYTVIVLYIVYRGGQEPATLTACFFTWATGELGWLAWVKVRDQEEEKHETNDQTYS